VHQPVYSLAMITTKHQALYIYNRTKIAGWFPVLLLICSKMCFRTFSTVLLNSPISPVQGITKYCKKDAQWNTAEHYTGRHRIHNAIISAKPKTNVINNIYQEMSKLLPNNKWTMTFGWYLSENLICFLTEMLVIHYSMNLLLDWDVINSLFH